MTCEIHRIVAHEVIVRIAEGKPGKEVIFDAPDEDRYQVASRSARRSLNTGASHRETEDVVIQRLGGAFDGAHIDRCSDDPTRAVVVLYNNA